MEEQSHPRSFGSKLLLLVVVWFVFLLLALALKLSEPVMMLVGVFIMVPMLLSFRTKRTAVHPPPQYPDKPLVPGNSLSEADRLKNTGKALALIGAVSLPVGIIFLVLMSGSGKFPPSLLFAYYFFYTFPPVMFIAGAFMVRSAKFGNVILAKRILLAVQVCFLIFAVLIVWSNLSQSPLL
jgi:hypothetical protein